MARVTAVLVVLTLAGSPAATIACAAQCNAVRSETKITCHAGDIFVPMITEENDGACLALFVWSPFLTENREWPTMKTGVHVEQGGPPVRTVRTVDANSFCAAPPEVGRSTPALVLRL